METNPPKLAPFCPIHPESRMEFIRTGDSRDWFECGHTGCSCAIDRRLSTAAPAPEPEAVTP